MYAYVYRLYSIKCRSRKLCLSRLATCDSWEYYIYEKIRSLQENLNPPHKIMQRIRHELVEGFKPLLTSALPSVRLEHELEAICHLPAVEIAAEEAIRDEVTIPDFEQADLLVLAELLKDTLEEEEQKRIALVIAKNEEARERGMRALQAQHEEYKLAKKPAKDAEKEDTPETPIPLEESRRFFAGLISEETTEPPLSDDFT